MIDKVDLTTKSFHVFGRLPSCDVPMEHPSLSRYHAVIQYCAEPDARHEQGWYLYDLDSTHGTWINKYQVKARVYQRLKVGFMVKFGGSSRLHVLQVVQPSGSYNSFCTPHFSLYFLLEDWDHDFRALQMTRRQNLNSVWLSCMQRGNGRREKRSRRLWQNRQQRKRKRDRPRKPWKRKGAAGE